MHYIYFIDFTNVIRSENSSNLIIQIFKVTKKLEESLKEINSVLAKYVSKVEGSKVSHPSKSGEEIKKKFSEGIEIINEEEEGSNKSQKQNSNTAPERPKKPLTPFFRFSN